MLSSKIGKKKFLIEFRIRKEVDSIDKKLILKLDTGSDVKAINWKTYMKLLQDVELKPSTVVLKNFDSTYVCPAGTFKCFLHWKSNKFRINVEVMNQENTPNILSRQTSILMGLIKPCFIAQKNEISREFEVDGKVSEETSSKDGLKRNKPKSVNLPEMTKSQ